ncbi:MAG: response regulator [Treponema sp.]|nr:response regulator [Treponema sp.]
MNGNIAPGLATKIAIIISSMLLAVNLLLGTILTLHSRDTMKTLVQGRKLDVANIAADMLDGDVLESLQAEDEGTPGYTMVRETLSVFLENVGLDYIYSIRDEGDGRFSFIIDPDPEDPGAFGEPLPYTDALFKASQGIPAVDGEPYSDRWGNFYSAYSPVFDSSGKVAGIVGVDFSASWFDSQVANQMRFIFMNSVIEIVFAILFVLVVTRRLRKKIGRMTEELGELAKDVDDLTRELQQDEGRDVPAIVQDGGAEELGGRIHSIKEGLRSYTQNVHTQANGMITALSSNYQGVYYINLDKDEGVCYLPNPLVDQGLNQGDHFPYMDTMISYAATYVSEKYRDAFRRFLAPGAIARRLANERIANFFYTTERNGKESYEMVRVAELASGEDLAGQTGRRVSEVGLGFSSVDDETRRTLLQNQVLHDALSVAEGASKAKTAFLSSMSHEIRTPMNAIIGLNRLALDDPDISASTRENLEKIGSAADHLLGIINDILDMSRIEAGKLVLKHEPFSLASLLDQVDIMIGGQCADKGLVWNWTLSVDGEGFYLGDGMKLKQVIINILGNSVKFTPEGGTVSLAVDRLRNYAGKSVFRFTMQDTGIGMSSDFLPKLFDPFSQEDGSTKTKYGSTGLGMSITKSIVEMMNGEIKVQSEQGVGTTFTVTVTLDDCTDVPPAGQEPDGQAGRKAGAAVDLTGRHVLVAEDVEVNAEILKRILDTHGVESDLAPDGRKAVEAFAASAVGHYDAILMDMRMPEMDGLEATRAIRAMDREDAKGIPIIALTANAFDEDVQRSLQSGLNAHLSKPIDPALLFETLAGLLG